MPFHLALSLVGVSSLFGGLMVVKGKLIYETRQARSKQLWSQLAN